MCGIAGFIRKEKARPSDGVMLEQMVGLIRHRGPDDMGTVRLSFEPNTPDSVYLGFVRLSIRDLSANGHQPMFSDDGRVCLLFNGEIYNADTIRQELLTLGYSFRGTSDTEVILKCYLQFGLEQTLSRLNGMFAIVLADLNRSRLFLCRDRVGEKPLYYYEDNSIFMVASEYKAFYANPDFTPVLNRESCNEFVLFNGLAGRDTLLEGVQIVEPGHYLEVSPEGNCIGDYQYYTLPTQKTPLSPEAVANTLPDRLADSVRSRMVSDVEVGVELSGGIDSTLVTVYASREKPDIKAFSIVFEDKALSEEPYVDQVVQKTGCRCEKVCLDSSEFLEDLTQTTYSYEAPLHHQGSIQLYKLCKAVRPQMKVLLTGESADELLGGYAWYPNSLYYQKEAGADTPSPEQLRGNQGWRHIGLTEEEAFLTFDTGIFYENFIQMCPHADYHKALKRRLRIFNETPGQGIQKRLNYEMRTFMVELLLRQDKISMANSIECRVPFSDQDLIAYVRENIPGEDLVHSAREYHPQENSLKTKLPLKALAKTMFGHDFAYRKKEGLHSPLEQYFYEDSFREFITTKVLPNVRRRGIFSYSFVNACYETHTHIQDVLWRVITFEVWAQLYLDDNGQGIRCRVSDR